MPLFEITYAGGAKRPDGKQFRVPPVAALRHLGPTLEVVVSMPDERRKKLLSEGRKVPDPVRGMALIDTGARGTAVDEGVCKKLELVPTGVVGVSHVGGSERRPSYSILIRFPNSPLPPIRLNSAFSVRLMAGRQPHILLFGRDLLARMRFVYNGPAGRIELAF